MAAACSSRSKRREQRRVQRAVAGEHARGVESHRGALKVGEGAARLAHDHRERRYVEDVHVGLDYPLERAARQEVVVHEVTVAADAAHLTDEAPEPPPARIGGERLEVAGGEEGRLELSHRADPHPLIVEEGASARLRPGELLVGRGAGDPEHEFAGAHERDLRGKERRVAHEGLGAIDRVDKPQARAPHLVPPPLLAVETVRGEVPVQYGADQLLGALVGLGDRRGVCLEAHRKRLAVERADESGGRLCGLDRCRKLARRHQAPAARAAPLRSPSCCRLCAVARIASSLERGCQPSSRRAFSLLALFCCPSCGRISRTAGFFSADSRTSQSGTSRVGTRAASAPRCSLSTRAICASDMAAPARARKRSPLAAGSLMARRCRSATSRTSTTPNCSRGLAGIAPSSMALRIWIEVEKSAPSTGPKTAVGLITASSRLPPSRAMKSQAARSARVLDFT